MSADNWTQCPRCYLTNRAKADELDKIASESYGKVSPEKFDELRSQAQSWRKDISSDDNFCSTLREDYDIGISKGKFYASYDGSCQACGFEFSFNHTEEVK